ncbi:hypothetical protein BDV96DRAFT_583563 [Lophiotrema nucula]|uniref:JmjC domain-containing protein n=1 Tax=Lophiotrema nucula TaxID=690887 RepID=A0A6A5YUK3_9PLEO|nr:hypothetical protein BDV96DRAFT_583563 [Lophiotrema nucula]
MDQPTPATSTPLHIVRLIQEELITAQGGDEILGCGSPALALLPHDPDTALEFAYQKLHDVPYKEVKTCWRRLYTDAALWKATKMIEQGGEDWTTHVVRTLDMALILTGAPGREDLIESVFKALETALQKLSKKRKRKREDDVPETFADGLKNGPKLRFQIARMEELSLEGFQTRISREETQIPIIITKAIDHWPATTSRAWNSPSYLLKKTLDGRRLVPIEIGRSYTEVGWSQKIISFHEFLQQYIFTSSGDTGYLAQHDLLTQIPSLRNDISTPDYCFADPPPHKLPHIKPVAPLEEPLLNAWFGPKGTISPLHTDPYHNVLAQVVGYKYVRLYGPKETDRLYPRGVDASGIDMHNTSRIDLDKAMAIYSDLDPFKNESKGDNGAGHDEQDQANQEFEDHFPNFKDAEYVEAVLGPGECLYIPVGWWHYVRSLTPSFSVSFWFN